MADVPKYYEAARIGTLFYPDIDFHAIAVETFKEYEQQGVHFINSTDPLPF